MSHWQLSLVLCTCTNLVLLCVFAQVQTIDENDISSRSLPAYAVASRANLLKSTCGKELRDFRDAVDHRILWSLKMLDSSGGPKPGFIYGNNFWLGSRSQCQDTTNRTPLDVSEKEILNNSLYRDPRKEFPPFNVNYFVAHFRHNSTLQYHVGVSNEDLITLGLCLPASCSINDLSLILERIFHDRVLFINDLYSVDFKLIEVRDLKDDHKWLFNGGILIIVVLMLIWCLMIIATIYDIFVHQKYLKAKNNLCIYNRSNATLEKLNSSTKDIAEQTELETSSLHRESKIGKVLICFSIYTNAKIIFNTKLEAGSLPAIHGIKSISMCWIIMIHNVYFLIDYNDNKPWAWRLGENFIAQIISNSTLSVDTYFFLSGFLLAYLYMKGTMGKEQTEPINYRTKLNQFLLSIMKRFIRLTPAYMMTLGIVYLNSSWYSKTSQFYVDEKPYETCVKYWWRNLLYINNLFTFKTMCMSWSWYLSADMQFFVIGSFLLILSSIYFYTAVAILGTLLIGSIVITGYISYAHEYIPILDEQYRLLDVLYVPPWIRIGPYIVGMITAYILLKLNKKLALKRRTVILYWCLAGFCNVAVLFGLYNRHISILATAFYVALSRTVWAIGLAWILIACHTNHAGMVNWLLSFKAWIPLSRLTYCAYLLNPFIISSIYLHNESSAHVDVLPLFTTYLGVYVICYICAFGLSLMSETPYVLLMRILIQSRSRKKMRCVR